MMPLPAVLSLHPGELVQGPGFYLARRYSGESEKPSKELVERCFHVEFESARTDDTELIPLPGELITLHAS